MNSSRSTSFSDFGEPIVTPRDSVRGSGRFVRLYLDDDLRKSERDIKIFAEILTSCTMLDFFIEQSMLSSESMRLRDGSLESKMVEEEIDRLKAAIRRKTGEESFAKGYKDLKLANTFILLTAFFQQEGFPGFGDEPWVTEALKGSGDSVDAFFDTMVPVNQLLNISKQIERDIIDSNLKYLAHQVALLYQALVAVRAHSARQPAPGERESLRDKLGQCKSRIEGNFEELKRVTEKAANPHLPHILRSWLMEELRELQVTVKMSFPCQERAKPFFEFMRSQQ